MEIKNLYSLIFDIKFLIKYGYFDVLISKKNIESFKKEDLKYGNADSFYLKLFNFDQFTEKFFDSELYDHYRSNREEIKKMPSTEPVTFTIPKNEFSRRQYKMPNLYSYLNLCEFMIQNKTEFIDVFNKNDFSTSKYFNQFDFTFEYTSEQKEKLLFNGNKIINIDLANFYPTLYTHSIPWVFMGKDNAKSNKTKGFSNNLDRLITKCQYDETHGIPTGNLASKIIAELYMCKIDEKMKDKSYVYSRYVDDISFSFVSNIEKDNFYRDLNELCLMYNLKINENKTSIEEFPYNDKTDKNDLFEYLNSLTEKNIVTTWQKKMKNFIKYAIKQESMGNKGSVKCIFPIILNTFKKNKINDKFIVKVLTNNSSNTGYNILSHLIDISLKDSRLTNRFITFINEINFLVANNYKISSTIRKYFIDNKKFIRDRLTFYNEYNYHQEQYQLLLYIYEFKIFNTVTKINLLELFNKNTDDFTLVLAMLIYLKKNARISDLLEKIDNLLDSSAKLYPKNMSRMSMKYWYFRYFVYYAQKINFIEKKDINSYCKNKGYISGRNGYISELNWKYIKTQGQEKAITDFYDSLIENEIPLINIK